MSAVTLASGRGGVGETKSTIRSVINPSKSPLNPLLNKKGGK